MKTLATIFTAALLFSAQIGNAQRYSTTGNAPSIHNRIADNVKVPDVLKNSNTDSQKVRVLFTIDDAGKAHVVEINTDRPDIIANVKKQIEAIDFSGSGFSTTEQYSIFLNFKMV